MRLNGFQQRLKQISLHPAWALIAAFGTYFCMYGFRKPYTAGSYAQLSFLGYNYKFLLILAQTTGYVLAKWVGIKLVAEIKVHQRILAILLLIGFAEAMLLLFAVVPAPWNAVCMFLNGLPLGVIFGLVLGFVEGRKHTEFLIAGLCGSFILSDGVSKSVGAFLLAYGVNDHWMPFLAGLVFLLPTLLFIAMLAAVPAPSAKDVLNRSARETMTGADRIHFLRKYAPGLAGIVLIYLFVTLLRSIRADFAVELWTGLGYKRTPDLFTQSEVLVSLAVIITTALAVWITDHYHAFGFSLFISATGFFILLLAVLGLHQGMDAFLAMVLIGLGIYIPYVAVHAIVFERLIAITREKATVGFLMYIVDSVGYTGYILLIVLRYAVPANTSLLHIFLPMCSILALAGMLITLCCHLYFKHKLKRNEQHAAEVFAG